VTNATQNLHEARSIRAGIAFMCVGVLFLVGLDVAARWLLQTYSLTQLIFLRCTFSVMLILMAAAARGQLGALRTARPGWHVTRSLLMAGSMLTFFHALRFIPLADIVIFAFAAPLIVTALSQPFLGERVGPLRWGAVIVGFAGVLVVLRPGSGSVHPAAIYAVIGAAFYAGLALTARRLSPTESTLSLSLYPFFAPLVIAGAQCVQDWQPPDQLGWALFFLCGVLGGLGIVCINAAYQRAPVAIIVPFEYTALLWAATAGFVVWGEIPDRFAWIGAAIITASGLFILWRETLAPPRSDVARPNFPLQEAAGTDPDPPE
jgi:drug/metabolite transporter (DMT)-like permease